MEFNEIINYVKGINEKDKLRLAIRLSETTYSNLYYDKEEIFERFNIRLKEIDEDRKNLNIPKYILMIVARIIELSKEEQNQIGLYLFN